MGLITFIVLTGIYEAISYKKHLNSLKQEISSNCKVWPFMIENEFENANYCVEDIDCKNIQLSGFNIPPSCNKYVYISFDSELVLNEIISYNKSCNKVYDKCNSAAKLICINNKCVK